MRTTKQDPDTLDECSVCGRLACPPCPRCCGLAGLDRPIGDGPCPACGDTGCGPVRPTAPLYVCRPASLAVAS